MVHIFLNSNTFTQDMGTEVLFCDNFQNFYFFRFRENFSLSSRKENKIFSAFFLKFQKREIALLMKLSPLKSRI